MSLCSLIGLFPGVSLDTCAHLRMGEHSPLQRKYRELLYGSMAPFIRNRYGALSDAIPSSRQFQKQVCSLLSPVSKAGVFPPFASFKSRCVPSSRQFQKQVCAGKDEEEGDKKQVVANKFGRFVTLAGRTNNKNIFVQKNN